MKSLSSYRPYDTMYIDAMNLLTRSYYGMLALEHKGQKTGMLYGVSRLVIDWRVRNPNIEFVMVWEGRDSWRKESHPIYKAQRYPDRSPDDAREFFDCVERVKYALPTMGVSQVWADTYEADDVAFTLGKSHPTDSMLLFSSGDWDWWEMSVYGDILYHHSKVMIQADLDATFENKYGASPVPPDKLWLFKVLTGDPSDNVSGIPRFPKKLASRVCNETGSGEGSVIDTLIRMGEPKWASKVSDNYWIIIRNTELLRSSEVPMDDMLWVDAEFDPGGFVDVLSKSGMDALCFKLKSRWGFT